jgi:hypothetical protein
MRCVSARRKAPRGTGPASCWLRLRRPGWSTVDGVELAERRRQAGARTSVVAPPATDGGRAESAPAARASSGIAPVAWCSRAEPIQPTSTAGSRRRAATGLLVDATYRREPAEARTGVLGHLRVPRRRRQPRCWCRKLSRRRCRKARAVARRGGFGGINAAEVRGIRTHRLGPGSGRANHGAVVGGRAPGSAPTACWSRSCRPQPRLTRYERPQSVQAQTLAVDSGVYIPTDSTLIGRRTRRVDPADPADPIEPRSGASVEASNAGLAARRPLRGLPLLT